MLYMKFGKINYIDEDTVVDAYPIHIVEDSIYIPRIPKRKNNNNEDIDVIPDIDNEDIYILVGTYLHDNIDGTITIENVKVVDVISRNREAIISDISEEYLFKKCLITNTRKTYCNKLLIK